METVMAVDATAASLGVEVAAARKALLETLEAEPGRWWSAYELKGSVRNGWSDGAMNLALSRLITEGAVAVEGDRVRLSG
jgi:hypothetical protein